MLEGPHQSRLGKPLRGLPSDAKPADAAFSGPGEAGDHVEQRRLAGAIGADQPDGLAGRDVAIADIVRLA